ncbi:MAG: tRNA (guanosine(37)-N1)-methyltransferase TrmD [Deltaproteobacteria bacterium]|jgi:tRNA (guanine37-N1)-methyltransferase|nr:tRNA (guanosine(37)-N1)-methyltransferase TrmD [Deltaproteobacteria bacterium]
MNINIITLFPEFFKGPLDSGLMRRAIEKRLVNFNLINPRSFTDDKRQTVDDRPYGGGPGMVMLLDPLVKALLSLGFKALPGSGIAPCPSDPSGHPCPSGPSGAGQTSEQATGRLLVMSPQGRPFNQKLARELAQEDNLTMLCARYEGFDARLAEFFALELISLGDFVLNGGESAALAVTEAAARLLPGFMGHEESSLEESFSTGLLEYPHYTRPEEFAGIYVPEILLNGNHAEVARWRRQKSLAATLYSRPDLLQKTALMPDDLDFIRRELQEKPRKRPGKNLSLALVHHPVMDKDRNTVSVSLTNLDIHDISRSSCTYGLANFFVVALREDQELILQKVLEHWVQGSGGINHPDRKKALSIISSVNNLEEALDLMEQKSGERPLVWGSSADYSKDQRNELAKNGRAQKIRKNKKNQDDLYRRIISFDEAEKILYTHSAVLLLGTGHGLAPEILTKCDHLLPPLRQFAEYNHLSVRCAGTVLLDRLLGEWG